MLESVIRFMCGQRLHGRTNSISGCCDARRCRSSSIRSPARRAPACAARHSRPSPAVEPAIVGLGDHIGRAFRMREHDDARMIARAGWRISAAVKRSCTSQWPRQAMISTLVSAATFCARYSSGSMMTRGAPKRFDHPLRIARGAADVALGLHRGRGVDVGSPPARRDSAARMSRTSAAVIEAASEQPAADPGSARSSRD